MGMEKKMIEQAEEELEILEAQHPNRFEYLKIELKSLIFLLHSQNITLSNNNNNFNKSYNFLSSSSNSILLPASSTATTQASSSNKKRKKRTSEMPKTEQPPPPPKQKIQRADWDESLCSNRRDGVEVAIEKAQACLLKIQQFKTSFY